MLAGGPLLGGKQFLLHCGKTDPEPWAITAARANT